MGFHWDDAKDAANEARIAGKKEVQEEDVVKRAEEKTKINLMYVKH